MKKVVRFVKMLAALALELREFIDERPLVRLVDKVDLLSTAVDKMRAELADVQSSLTSVNEELNRTSPARMEHLQRAYKEAAARREAIQIGASSDLTTALLEAERKKP